MNVCLKEVHELVLNKVTVFGVMTSDMVYV
jgi:hypothetical protein